MNRWRAAAWMGAVMALAGAASATAAPVSAGQCAADAALAGLIDAVWALRLSDETTVGELWSASPAGEHALRQRLLQDRQLSPPRRTADGAIEVEASLSVQELNRILQDLAGRFPTGRSVPPVASAGADRSMVAATGRWQGPPPAQAGPAGWRHCDAGQLEQVAAAARTDAVQHLMAAISQWRLSASQKVGDLWARRPDYRQAVEDRAAQLPLGEPLFEPTGLCRRVARCQRADIVKLLVSAADACTESIEADLTSAIDPDGQEVLLLEGLAVAPPVGPQHRPARPGDAPGRPEWADHTLSVRVAGQAPAHVADPGERSRMATAAAVVEAKRQVWLQIEALVLPSGATVGDVLAADRRSPVIRTLDEALAVQTSPAADGADQVTVTLEIPLEAVWQVMADRLPRPPAAPASRGSP